MSTSDQPLQSAMTRLFTAFVVTDGITPQAGYRRQELIR
jgi:hypothetical protein